MVRAICEAGYDVIVIAESATSASDEAMVERVFNERRVLITEDRDFGELVYARGRSSANVVFVKFPAGRGAPNEITCFYRNSAE